MASTTPEDKAKLLAEEVKGKTSALKNLVAGGVGGLCAVIVGQPFDMVSWDEWGWLERALAAMWDLAN